MIPHSLVALTLVVGQTISPAPSLPPENTPAAADTFQATFFSPAGDLGNGDQLVRVSFQEETKAEDDKEQTAEGKKEETVEAKKGPKRRALPAPLPSPPMPSGEYQGYPLVGVPVDTTRYPVMKCLQGTW